MCHRFREDSPTPELDWRSPKSKRTSGTPIVEVLEGRRLRKCRRNIPAANGCTSSSSKGTCNTLRQSPVPLEANSNRRRGRMVDNLEALSSSCVMTQSLKKARPSTSETDDPLLECTLLNCNKKFRHISGLNYHQSHAHKKTLVDESKPEGGKLDGGLEAPLPTDTDKSEVTHEENDDCGVESSSTKDLSTDVVVPVAKEDLAGSTTQVNCCVDKPVCLDVTLPASLSIESSCTSGAPVVDTCTSGPGLDGKHSLKVKENHVSPPPRPSKEPSSESEQSSVSTPGLSRPPSVRQVPQDTKSKDGGKNSRASDADKSHVAETKVGGSPAPSVLSSVLSSKPGSSCHKPLPSASDDKEGKSCVISSTGDHQSQSESPTGSLSTSAATVVSSSASSGFPISSDNKSPNYSDISDSAEFLGQADPSANGHQQQQQGKDGDTKKQQRPVLESRQQKSKHETTGSQSHSSSSTSGVSTLHPSVPLSNGQPGNDPVRLQRMKESEPPAKETIDCSSASSYSKPTSPPEEKPSISRTAYHADIESEAQAKEHRLWLESLHHHHQHHHQNSAIASSMAMASSAAAAMNMMPYGYGLDQAAYHLQFLSQNPETRSQYERWLMEQSHYLQQQQNHHHHQQQQRCFNKMMQAEAERGPSSDSKPVDMTSKGPVHPSNDSTPSLAPPKPKSGIKPDGKPSDGGKSLYKWTLNDWMSRSDSVPSSNGITDPCGDMRKTTAQPSGRNNASKEKSDSIRPEQLNKGKDALWERNERAAMNKSSSVIGQETGSPDLSASHLTPISKASNPVGNISPYSSGNPSGLLKNFVQDPSHQSLIGYNGGASFMDLSEASSVSPNSKFLDLDSKQVVTGSNLRRSGDGRHSLDVLRYQSAMYGKQPTAEHLGSNGPKHNRSTLSKDFLEEPGHTKDGKGSPSGHSSPLTLRHLHTHHHTHVVGAAYPLYGSYNGKREHISDS